MENMKMKNSKMIKTITKNSRSIKKLTVVAITALCIMTMATVSAFAASGTVDPTNFIKNAMTVLKSVICLIGGGLGIWGVVNLIEGYGSDNPGAKSQGIKQFVAGLGLIILALVMVPVLQNMFLGAI